MALNSDDGSREPWLLVLQRSRPYLSEQQITDLKPNRHISHSRDQQAALAVFNLIWSVADAMGFPNRTRCTAMALYHRLRLYYHDIDYNLADVALASLFTACKFEDTLKKSLEIQAVAYNLRYPNEEPVNSDSPLLEEQHRRIIGIERQILEACSFDFRTRHHQPFLVKFAKYHGLTKGVTAMAWLVSIDAHKTFACLKATPQELALAALILASRLHNIRLGVTQLNTTTPSSTTNSPIDPSSTFPPSSTNGHPIVINYHNWKTSFSSVLETCHDILDLYTDHINNTFVGPKYGADAFIRVRIELNREARNEGIPANNNGGGVVAVSPVTPLGNGYGYGTPSSYNGTNGSGKEESDEDLTAGDRLRGGARGQQLVDRSLTGSVRFILRKTREDDEWKAINEGLDGNDQW